MDIIAEATEAYLKFWSTWGSRDSESHLDLMAMIHPAFNGFGTNSNEVWDNRKHLKLQHKEEINQISEPYVVNHDWYKSTKISKKTVLFFGELSLTVKINTKIVILEKVRTTLVFNKTGDEFKIKHWHCSLPDLGTTGEVVPGAHEPKRYEDVSVFFCDFVNFTKISSNFSPKMMVAELSDIYQNFDTIMKNEGLEKIQVYGDGYLAVCGLPDSNPNHAVHCVQAGKKIFSYLKERNKTSKIEWHARIGIHSGPLVAGVIGERKFSFNIFGDTVNTAARIEAASIPEKINVSQTTYDLIKDNFNCEYRGKIEAKGKGEIDMYFVD